MAPIEGYRPRNESKYTDVNHGYKMIGNAVNVDFAEILAKSIMEALNKVEITAEAS